eukprot:6195130-Prymnesium_polylepis.2
MDMSVRCQMWFKWPNTPEGRTGLAPLSRWPRAGVERADLEISQKSLSRCRFLVPRVWNSASGHYINNA